MAKLLTALWSLCLCMNSYNYLLLQDSRVCCFFVSPIRLQSPWGQRSCSTFLCLLPAPSSACPTLQCTLLNMMESGWQHSHNIACVDWPTGRPALPNKAVLGLGWLPVPEGNSLYSACQMGFILLDSDFSYLFRVINFNGQATSPILFITLSLMLTAYFKINT